MSDLMRSVLDSLLPQGSAWRIRPDGDLSHLLDGVADNLEVVRAKLGDLGLVRDPWRTPYLEELERDYGIDPNTQLTDAQRRSTLALVEFARLRRGTPDDMQEALDRAGLGDGGLGLHVYANDPSVDPGLFVAGGAQTWCGGPNAYCGYSIDGISIHNWSGIAWNGSVFCAVSEDGYCATSPDAITWTTQSIAVAAWKAVTWNGSLFCAIGTDVCATSPTGVTWTPRTIAAGDWRALCWDGTQFCAVGAGPTNYAATSPTGTTWTPQGGITARTWQSIAWNGSVFCAGGIFAIATSPTGVTWTVRNSSNSAGRSAAWNGTLFVVTSDTVIYVSQTGISWTGYSIASGITLYATIWAPSLNLFVSVGSGSSQCITSPDGAAWTIRTIASGAWRAIAWNTTNLLCAIGSAALHETTSPDAIEWTAQLSGILAYCGTHGGGMFIVNGDVVTQAPAYLCCGNTEACCGFIPTGGGDITAVCGRYITLVYTPVVVLSPTDPGTWPFVFFLAASVTKDADGYIRELGLIDVPANQRAIIMELVMRWKPAHTWAALMVTFS